METMMLKATKLMLAAAFLAGGSAIALAQATQPPTPTTAIGKETGTAPDSAAPGTMRKNATGPSAPHGMTQRPTGMPTAPGTTEQPETGTAPDTASGGALREGPGAATPGK